MSETNDLEDVDLDEENNEDEEVEEEDTEATEKEEETKTSETPEAKKARLERQLKSVNKKLGIEEKKPTTESKPSELDYGKKAFLVANGIKGKEEVELVESVMKESGKSLEDVLETKYFQSELTSLREDLSTKKAVPSSTSRSQTSSRDKVDYWMSKGELPPEDQPKLRREVVQAKRAKASDTNKFSPTSVVTS